MRKALAALLLFLGLASAALAENTVGPTNQIICNKVAQASPVTATTTSLITAVTGQTIFICGWHVTSNVATTATFQLEYGTGATCTSPTTVTPAFNVTNTAPSSDHISYATTSTIAGSQLCVVTTGSTVGMAVEVFYSQF